MYIAGYAIETILKARICKTLKWISFPETNRDFDDYRSLRTHNLEVLLHLSGYEANIKAKYIAEWTAVTDIWHSELRYSRVGFMTDVEATKIVRATIILLNAVSKTL